MPKWKNPELPVLRERVRVVSIPMRVKFRGILHREALLLQGTAGWGEFSPFPEYSDEEAVPWLASALEAAEQGYPAPLRTSIPVNGTVPAVPVGQVETVLARFGAVTAVKVKVAEAGQAPAEDLARVAEVRRLLPDAGIRVDANAGWDVPTAVDTLTRLAEAGLEYAEQPVAGIDGLRAVRTELRRRGVPVLVAADESVRKESDPLKVAREDAADLIVIKAAPLGGVRRAVEIVQQAGLPAVVSSAIDTSVGIRTGVALAAALPELPYACGLGTLSLMAGDVTEEPLLPDGGALAVRDVAVSEELMERFAATPERTQWWLDRLERVYALRHKAGYPAANSAGTTVGNPAGNTAET